MLKIRDAVDNDATQLSHLAFRSKAHWGYSDEFMKACKTTLTVSKYMISRHSSHCSVAEIGSKAVAFYTLNNLTKPEIELDFLFVDPNHIGTGIGRTLFSHAKEYAFSKGGELLYFQGDPQADKFYIGGWSYAYRRTSIFLYKRPRNPYLLNKFNSLTGGENDKH